MARQYLDQYEPPYSYFHIGTATGTVTNSVSANPGTLYYITVNQKASAASLMTVYDNTTGSGTIIGVIDPTAQVQSLFFGVAVTKGITIVAAPGTNTGPDCTVAFI